MRRSLISFSAVAMVAFAAPAAVPMRMAVDRPETAGGSYQMVVTSPAFAANGPIPAKYVDRSPPLSWDYVRGALSYALIVEDADAGDKNLGIPFVHWVAWNITAMTKNLPEGAAERPSPGFVQGKNQAGKIGYFGPHPPPGPPHHYHFQLFAVAGLVNLPTGATREELLRTIKDHVVGKGELVATFASGR